MSFQIENEKFNVSQDSGNNIKHKNGDQVENTFNQEKHIEEHKISSQLPVLNLIRIVRTFLDKNQNLKNMPQNLLIKLKLNSENHLKTQNNKEQQDYQKIYQNNEIKDRKRKFPMSIMNSQIITKKLQRSSIFMQLENEQLRKQFILQKLDNLNKKNTKPSSNLTKSNIFNEHLMTQNRGQQNVFDMSKSYRIIQKPIVSQQQQQQEGNLFNTFSVSDPHQQLEQQNTIQNQKIQQVFGLKDDFCRGSDKSIQIEEEKKQQHQSDNNQSQFGFFSYQQNIPKISNIIKNRINKDNIQIQQQQNKEQGFESNNNNNNYGENGKIYLEENPFIEQKYMAYNYADDYQLNFNIEPEDIQQQIQEQDKANYDLNKSLKLSVNPLQTAFKLSSNSFQKLPIQVSVKAEEMFLQDGNQKGRPSIDLICVIDNSSSMTGYKIELVKESLKSLVKCMNQKDRISLITFSDNGERLIPLTTCSLQNIQKIFLSIDLIQALGGTSIEEGIGHTLRTIQQRRFINQITSVFLLSDGQDKKGLINIKKLVQNMNLKDNFTIHSFGFGADHDPELMVEIAKLNDGNFYYIEKLNKVDEMFMDALGGLFSVAAQNITITVKLTPQSQTFSNIRISKTYGEMWHYNMQKNEYTIKILQLIAGVQKDFLLELDIPPINNKITDLERNTVFIEASISLNPVNQLQQNLLEKQANLEITLYNEDENIVPSVNESVQINLLRVRWADSFKQAIEQAEKGDFKQSQIILGQIQNDISNTAVNIQLKLSDLSNDINKSQHNCNDQLYNSNGKSLLFSAYRSHMEQRSSVEKIQYQNLMQSSLNQQLSQLKKNQYF